MQLRAGLSSKRKRRFNKCEVQENEPRYYFGYMWKEVVKTGLRVVTVTRYGTVLVSEEERERRNWKGWP